MDMHSLARRCLAGAGIVLTLAAGIACGGSDGDDDALGPAEQAQRALRSAASALHYDGTMRDAAEFFRPHDGGNGRSCATCHRPEDGFGLTPKTVEARWQRLQQRRQSDPGADDPLFRPIDADDFAQDFTTLRTKALVRVTVPLPANVTRADDASATTVSVWRAVPTVVNAAMTPPYQHDGSQPTLEAQARAAMRTHSQLAGEAEKETVSRIAEFQRRLFSSERVAQLSRRLDDGDTTAKAESADPPLDALQLRGRETFGNFCASCHGGATQTRNEDARFLPIPSRGPRASGAQDFVAIFVGTPRTLPPLPPPVPPVARLLDTLPSAGLPEVGFRVRLPSQAVVTNVSSDPGRGLVSGDLRDFGRFDIPTLYGISLTAPYFHDNTAPDLDAVIEHYQALFRVLEFLDVGVGLFAPAANGQGCDRGTCGFKAIPDADVGALKAYLERLGR